MLPRSNPEVVFCAVDEGGVLLHTREEVYFGLNDVGAKIWQLLPPTCATLDDLVAAIAPAYPDIAAEVLRADIAELLGDLERNGLVVPHA